MAYSFGGRTFSSLEDLQRAWDDSAYLAANPDVAKNFTGDASWANTWGDRGLTHFLRYGSAEGRNPFFLSQPSQSAPTSTPGPSRDTTMAQQFDQGLLSVVGRDGGDTTLSPNAASQNVERWKMTAGQNAYTNATGSQRPNLSLFQAMDNYFGNADKARTGGMTFTEDTATPSYVLGSLRNYLPQNGSGDPMEQNYWVGNEFVMPDAAAPVWNEVDAIKFTKPQAPNASTSGQIANQATGSTVTPNVGSIVPNATSAAVSSALSSVPNSAFQQTYDPTQSIGGMQYGDMGSYLGRGLELLTGVPALSPGLGLLGNMIGVARGNGELGALGLEPSLGLGTAIKATLPFGQSVQDQFLQSLMSQAGTSAYRTGTGGTSTSASGPILSAPLAPQSGGNVGATQVITSPNAGLGGYTDLGSAISSALSSALQSSISQALGGVGGYVPTPTMYSPVTGIGFVPDMGNISSSIASAVTPPPVVVSAPPTFSKGGFCFSLDTLVEMADGRVKRIGDIEIGEETRGGRVVRTVEATGQQVVSYRGVRVTPNHPVKFGDVWAMAGDVGELDGKADVKCLETTGGRIWVDGVEFADMAAAVPIGPSQPQPNRLAA